MMVTLKDAIQIAITADGTKAAAEFKKVGLAAKKDLGKVEEGSKNMSAQFAKAGAVMGGAALVAGAALFRAGQAASDLNESVNKSTVIFGAAAGKAEEFADSAAKIGISKREALEAAGSFGVLFTGIGKSASEAEKMSEKMVNLAADMGSFNNVPVAETLLAIQSGLRGEAEPLRRFGVLLDDATLKAQAMKDGLIKTTTQALTPGQKAQAAYSVILAQTAKQQGDFARTSDGLANTQKKVTAQFENLTAKVGEAALPVMQQFADVALAVVGAFESLPEPIKAVIGPAAVITTGLLAISSAASFVAAGFTTMKAQALAAAAGLRTAGAAAAATPWTLLAVGVGAAVGQLLMADDATDDVSDALKGVGQEAAKAKKNIADLARVRLIDLVTSNDDLRLALDETNVSAQEFADAVLHGGDAAASVKSKIDAFAKSHRQLNADGEGTFVEVEKLTGELDKQSRVFQTERQAADAYAKAVADGKKANTDTAPKVETLTEKLEKQRAKSKKLHDALFEAVDGVNALHNAERDAATASLDYEDALQNQKDKTADLAAAIKEFGVDSDEARQAHRDLQRAVIDTSGTFDDSKQSLLESASALAGGKRSGEKFRQELEKLRDGLAPGSPLRAFLDGYISDLGKIPPQVSTTVTTTFKTEGDADRANSQGGVKRKAGGGLVEAGMPYIVGEVGPEPFFPAVNGRVISHADAMSAIRSGGGKSKATRQVFGGTPQAVQTGNVYHITVTTLDARTAGTVVVDALKAYERSHGRVPIKVAS